MRRAGGGARYTSPVHAIATELLSKSFERGRFAVRDVTLRVRTGEMLALMGPSGCGKTTLLRLIAGLEKPDEGRILIGDKNAAKLRPHERDVALVFQNHALYPHLTMKRNLTFPLRMRGVAKAAREARALETARLLRIDRLLDRKPGDLSGGERQRAAVARALVRGAACVLFDEPLSNLEHELRCQLQREIRELQRTLGFTAIWVTHDQAEAQAMGDRILLMKEARLLDEQTTDNPHEGPPASAGTQ